MQLWQIGNETSYDPNGFDRETAARKTLAFARAMRKADPGIQLIGWGDGDWAPRMCEVAGEELAYVAFHNGFGPGGEDSPLRGLDYRKDPDKTWEYLFRAREWQAAKIKDMRERVAPYKLPLALTECHFGLPGRNRNEVLSTWAAGVAYAAVMNVHERNGDVLKIATLADFCGTRWQNNAIMIPVPGGRSFMMPVAMAASLYRRHTGAKAVAVTRTPGGPRRGGQPHRGHGVPPRGQHAADAVGGGPLRGPRRGGRAGPRRVVCAGAGVRGLRVPPRTHVSAREGPRPGSGLGLPGGVRLGRGTQPAPNPDWSWGCATAWRNDKPCLRFR